MKISTNWLKEFVTLAPPLERLADRLTMAGLEVKRIEPRPELKDTLFEIEVTPNRPDWLSHWGVAREIHAVENTGLKLPSTQIPEHRPMPSAWRLELREAEGCPYYTACLIEGVQGEQSPEWMRNRLLACGFRSINLIVDITNYVLLETGQPLHAFDADLVRGKQVVIRRAKPGEGLVAIDETRYSLSPEDLVIADREEAVAIAGVMGGSETEVSLKTRNLLLESAFFHPAWVRRSSRRLGLATESSYRFERRVDPEGVDRGRERAIQFFRELAGARSVSAVLKAGQRPTLEKSRISLSLEQVKKLLGMEIKPHEIHSLLTRLDLEVKKQSAGTWSVGIPSFRWDLTRPVDLVEEVARIGGYEKIPRSLPERPPIEIPPSPLRDLEEKTRNFLAGIGLYETVTFSLTNPRHFETGGFELKEAIEIHNPIHQELTLLRPSFLVSLLEVLARNERAGAESVSVFEVASLYSRRGKSGTPCEAKSLGILLAGEKALGWSGPKRPFDFFDLKGVLEAYFEFLGLESYSFVPHEFPFFERGAQIGIGKETVGFLGLIARPFMDPWDLRSQAFFAELSLEKLVLKIPEKCRFREFPRYPAIKRDLAVVVDETLEAGEIVRLIRDWGEGLVGPVELFDLFRGGRIPKGRKNLAFRVTYQSLKRTLLSEEVERLHSRIAAGLAKKFQAAFQEK